MSEHFRSVALTVQRVFNQFDPTAAQYDEAEADVSAAPIFILSAPRSGSTLLYQVMVRTTGVCFISNVMSLLPRYMLRLARHSLRRAPAAAAPYHPGDYGFIPGLYSPSEAGKVIDRWFERDSLEQHRSWVRRTVVGLRHRTGRPLLVKALPLALKLDAVAAVFPNARLVLLRRDPLYVVQSLYLGQTDAGVAADRWAGVEPPGISAPPGSHPIDRAARQVAELERRIEAGARAFPTGNVARVDYHRLCDDPAAAIAAVASQFDMAMAEDRMPRPFRRSVSQKVSPALWRQIEDACAGNGL